MSKLKRFLILPEEREGDRIVVSGSEFHHIVNVMRFSVGDRAILGVGDGVDLLARVHEILKDKVIFRIEEERPNPAEPRLQLSAYLALLKSDHLEFAVQKLSELGLRSVTPFVSEHTVAKGVRADRLVKIARESAKQCERSGILQIREALSFDRVLRELPLHEAALFCCEFERATGIRQALNALPEGLTRLAVIIGPEGGFSEKEKEEAVRAGAVSVSLGPRILRAETAAVAACTCAMYRFGEMEGAAEVL